MRGRSFPPIADELSVPPAPTFVRRWSNMNGLHILAEFFDCRGDARLLSESPRLADLCREVCAAAGLTVVAQAFHQFAGAGATGAIVLAESHLTIHTWPELNAVSLDVYVCNFSRDNRAAARQAFERLHAAFQPERLTQREISRGALDAHQCD